MMMKRKLFRRKESLLKLPKTKNLKEVRARERIQKSLIEAKNRKVRFLKSPRTKNLENNQMSLRKN